MRHGKKINHLGRTHSHRKALLSNMAASLILHKRINTTLAKAKALRKYVEPIITRSKDDSTHSRRTVFSYLQNKEAVMALFSEVAPKVADRPGGYTRIIKLENRPGDNADMCMMELVDFNLIYGNEGKAAAAPAKKTTRRGGAAKKKAADDAAGETAEPKAAKKPAAAKKPKAEPKDGEAAPKKTTRKKKED
jgi:large subunit ribosomal protein L17